MHPRRRSLAVLVLVAATSPAFASEQILGYSQNSETAPVGSYELEVWNTFSSGREPLGYQALTSRLELETGITPNTQIAVYLNWAQVHEETSPGVWSNGGEFKGTAFEVKHKLADASVDPIGIALYGELGVESDELELEAKLILDKRQGRHYFATNLTLEGEFEHAASQEWESALIAEVSMGYAYHLTEDLSLGVEMVDRNHIAGGEWEYSALYFGPVAHVEAGKFWATLTLLPQISALRGDTHDNLVLSEESRFEVRLIAGFEF